MRLSTATEQACCILALIASRNLSPITNGELSARMAVSPSYLTKITRRLVIARANLVRTWRKRRICIGTTDAADHAIDGR